ncbi:MAG: disulfide bond formation protein B [Alphaproteobacteria bacterium]|nr:disulfide bond formation protein B [Alphaproteobacteria bacterium]
MRILSPRAAPALLAHGSAALLLGALAFQHWVGLAPCALCLYQRWPHVVAIAAGLAGMFLIRQGRAQAAGWATLVAAAALAVTAAIGAYHAGVEWQWWQGPQACSGTGPVASSAASLREQLLAAPVIRCDDIVWSLFGISMAGWNFLLSGALALVGLRGGWTLTR